MLSRKSRSTLKGEVVLTPFNFLSQRQEVMPHIIFFIASRPTDFMGGLE